MAEVLHHKLIMVSSAGNNNKFYELYLDGNNVIAKYGRVGANPQIRTYPGGESVMIRKLKEKSRKGYIPVQALGDGGEADKTPKSSKATLAPIAAGINRSNEPAVTDLIDKLIEANKHAIEATSGGRITVSDDGIVRTPLGVITLDAVTEAQNILDRISAKSKATGADVDQYLSLIPQKVNQVSSFVSNLESVEGYTAQNDFLDQLRTSSSIYADRLAASKDDPEVQKAIINPFRYQIDLADSSEFAMCQEMFNKGVKGFHSSARMRLRSVYRVIDGDAQNEKWAEVKANSKNWSRMLWHGTMTENLLSIMHKGFYVPPTLGCGIHIAGRMFGDGVYFATSSTKSLNYSAGSWAGRRYNNAFMFLSDVVTGHEFRTDRSSSAFTATRDARDGKHDSLFVRANTCGVVNDEIIVWDTDRIKISYLCEFAS